MNRTTPFSMRLDPALKDELQRVADSDRRTLTNLIEKILMEWMAEINSKKVHRK